nr:lysozyme g-like isoform X1 [Labrus bergylta]
MGDIMRVQTSGASQQTANQDNLRYSGVRASHTMAQTDAGRMEEFRSKINRVGTQKGIPPALIAAIISRESRAGNAIKNTGGWGDHGNGWGLMQVDVNPNGGGHTAQGAWDSEEHLRQATGILVHFIGRISTKFPNWSPEQKLKGLFHSPTKLTQKHNPLHTNGLILCVFNSPGGIAAYNMGDGNVHSYENVDDHTTGRDYSNDVVARAQWYRNHGGF